MVERLGVMTKGRRERFEKGSRERIEKRERDIIDNLKRRALEIPPPLFLDPTLQCNHCFLKYSGYDKLELKHQNLFFTSY